MIPEKPRKRITLSCGREELLYEIRQICYVSGDVLPEETQDSKHQIQDVGEDGNVDLITRRLGIAHAEVEDMLCNDDGNYIEDGCILNDNMCEERTYDITVTADGQMRRSAAKLLQQYYHGYLVANVVSWWFTLVHPNNDKAQLWEMEREMYSEQINNVINRIPKNLMIHPHPY